MFRRFKTGSFLFLILVGTVLSASLTVAADVTPVTSGHEGERAFADLGAFYADAEKVPPYDRCVEALNAGSDAEREAAGRYLLALFQQMLADETNGRTAWRSLPYWGGGQECDARELRKRVAGTFGENATGEPALAAALWLIDADTLPQSNEAGVHALRRIEGPAVNEAFAHLLAQPHANVSVAVGVIEEVGKRRIRELRPQITRLCTHYRSAVREAASKAAHQLGVDNLPEYEPARAFTPWLDEQLAEINEMVFPAIPESADWLRFSPSAAADDQSEFTVLTHETSGWLVEVTADEYVIVTRFGNSLRLSKSRTTAEPRSITDDVEELLAVRAQAAEDSHAMDELSGMGRLSGQFEPDFVSVPEALLSAWCWQRGKKEAAARLLFPRIDAMADDRWLVSTVRELLGHRYHQRCWTLSRSTATMNRPRRTLATSPNPCSTGTNTKAGPGSWRNNSRGAARTSSR